MGSVLQLLKPGHGFMISSLTLEFVYLVGSCPQDGNVNLSIGIGGIAVHSRILVDIPSGSACGITTSTSVSGVLNATGLAVETLIGSTITLYVQGSKVIFAEGLQCPAPRLVSLGFYANPSQRSVVEHLPINVPMTL